MSLVDYASSDEEDEDSSIKQRTHDLPQPSKTSSTSHNSQNPRQFHSNKSLSDQASKHVSPMSSAPVEKLPDASLLLSSPLSSQPIGSDHSSRVAAAMADNLSRKREANGSNSSYIRGKIPKGILPHSKNIPDTSSGLLMPPQLRLGRLSTRVKHATCRNSLLNLTII
ncbi:uncharacterized protein LOC104887444 isoform X2 [Beta vulgaris subsp. vulgaris]|uniref:uncharacterized protein LOC104887444 isoform X2 n=1 Tax=Beta vulgaris subsp. vulgaris TaxID=3555 RepID=UPI00053FCD1C|nr:uncharacterized protein LOC104887444 isoform X2 [Beta vulgaris subsp. vulgaris]